MAISFYVLDLETTGLSKDIHEITELCLIRAEDRMTLNRQVKVNHPENASFDAMKITGKSFDDLKKGISPIQLIKDVEDFLAQDGIPPSHKCLIGHNLTAFDRVFLWKLWEDNNKKFGFDMYLDTLHMARDYGKKIGLIKPKLSLGASCDLLQIKKVAGEHNASSDTKNTYFLWERLMKEVDYLKHIKRLPHNETQYDDNDTF
jgi:DNA polymerase III alpha subunit (gram-positive type)